MKCPEHSEFQKQIQKAIEIGAENVQIEHCSLLPRTTHELKLMFDSCIFSEMNISQQVIITKHHFKITLQTVKNILNVFLRKLFYFFINNLKK